MDDETKIAFARMAHSIRRNGGYLARLEIERLLERYRMDPKRLEPFGFKVYSQNDEDGIIEEIFRRLDVKTGTFCEIGVENGLECNTLYLIHKGWTGAWIEADSRQAEAIRSKFDTLLSTRRLQVAIASATAENVNQTFEQFRLGDIDFLSIDIDGNDIHLFRALRSAPKVICIEYNAKFPANIKKAQVYDPQRTWTGTDYMGSSLASLNEVAEQKGYRLVATNITGANAFFVRNDLAQALFTESTSLEYLYNPPRYWLLIDHFLNIGHRADFGPYEDLMAPNT